MMMMMMMMSRGLGGVIETSEKQGERGGWQILQTAIGGGDSGGGCSRLSDVL